MLKNKAVLIFICIILLSAVVSGCTPKKDYDALKKEYETSQSNLTSAQREYEFLKSQMTTLQKEWDANKATLEAEVARQSTAVTDAKNTNATLTQNIATLNSKLENTLNTEIKFSYTFSYLQWRFTWDLSLPLKEYLYYKEKTRPTDTTKYTTMVTDSHGNVIIDKLVKQIKDASLNYDLKKTDTVNLVAAFVQSLVYSNKNIATPYDDYPRYPIETLFDQGGDCEDTSILTAALLQRLEYNQVFFVFAQPKHVALGIDVAGTPFLNDGWEYQSKRYFYLETTGEKYVVGISPTVYVTLQPAIYPVGK